MLLARPGSQKGFLYALAEPWWQSKSLPSEQSRQGHSSSSKQRGQRLRNAALLRLGVTDREHEWLLMEQGLVLEGPGGQFKGFELSPEGDGTTLHDFCIS